MKICTLLLLMFVIGCQSSPNNAPINNELGVLQYSFPISEGAKPAFDEGLLLLHSFEYEDAQEAFQRAIAIDSNEVMAHWGEAMTHYKALWGLQDLPAGREVMGKLGSTQEERLSKAEEGIERDFWMGVEILFGEGELVDRNQQYANHMSELYDRYEGDQEVAAFYSLALMWAVPVGRDVAAFERSANVAAGILKENPNHPGALHYTIHAFDDPDFASQAIFAANKYANVAPDAVHALHMPSHIYLAQGMWKEMVTSNEVSYAASVSRMKRKGLGDAARGYHSLHWLHYGYLQQGRVEEASQLMKDMLVFTPSADTRSANAYLVSMQNSQLVETGEWNLEEAPLQVDYDRLSLQGKTVESFFRSLQAAKMNDAAIIQEQIALLEPKITASEMLVTNEGIAVCSAGPSRYAPNKNTILRGKTILNQMKALIATIEGNDERTEEYLMKAVEFEAASDYSTGPPDIPYPSFEHYGEWLLENGRFEEALAQFDESLSRAPLRAKALRGKIASLKGLERMNEVDEIQQLLNGNRIKKS